MAYSRQPPRPITTERLERSALAYLQRFASSKENLRRVLRRKLHTADAEARPVLAAFIDTLVDRFESSGLLNDATYVEGRVASLRRQGASTRAIALKLRTKGVDRDQIAEGLEADAATDAEAAWAFARRRRLGPYRSAEARPEMRHRDMAAMGRGGFDYQTARGVIDAPEPIEGAIVR